MNDRSVLDQINELAKEEATLLEHAEGHGLSSDEERRLHTLEVHLDQCWDLLRQRRARRGSGLDPDQAHVRDATTVERYQQ
jgi:hypothetical protein